MMKKLLIFSIIMILVTGMSLFSAGDKGKKPTVKKGAEELTITGVTRHWKDVEKISKDEFGKMRRMRPVLNFEDPRKIVKKTDGKDPVVQSDFGTARLKGGMAIMTTPIKNFAGMNLNSNGAGWPPDTNGDVGLNYYIQTVNTSIGIYNKSTGALVSATTFDNFMGGTGITGTPCDNDNNGDPIVLFDQYAERWFILDFAWDSSQTDGSYYSIAASKTSDPTGEWWQYAMRADDTLMNDYPKCGVWHDGIYITANMFNFSTSAFQHVKVWALKTPDLYNGTLTAQYVTDTSSQAWSIMPVNAKGATAPSSTAPCYMYSIDADEYGGGSIDALYVWKYDVDWSNSANTTWTGHSTMNVASYGLTASRIPQDGTSQQLDSLYGRLMFPAMYRKFATHESVYLCHLAEYNNTRTTRWYEVRISNGNSSIYQQGTYAPDTNHRWMASIGADKNGSIAMGYSVSSSSMKPAIRYAGRLATDTLGTMGQGEETLIQGNGYQTSYTRWGDYSSITIDPSDDETFWFTTEYYAANGTNWQTRIGSFKVSNVADTTPPVISNVASGNLGDTTARITWDTDESATSTVHYGTTTSYGSTETVSGYATGHTVNLSGLTANTTYHYKVVSEDAAANSAESSDYTFTTTDTPATPDMFIHAIDMSSSWFWRYADIYVKDSNGNFVSGATVYITWSGGSSGSSSGVTDANGKVTFQSGFTFSACTITVTNVTHASYNYNSALNVETSDTY